MPWWGWLIAAGVAVAVLWLAAFVYLGRKVFKEQERMFEEFGAPQPLVRRRRQ
jgi:uncharacterized protein YdgA (DUF945 family)